MKKRILMLASLVGSAVLSHAALTTGTTYTGTGPLIDVVYNNTSPTKGSIDSITTDSWDTGLPSDSNPGLFTGGAAETATGANVWYGVAVRQTGGTLSDTSLSMRGGAEDGSSLHSTLEIDDISNTDFSSTNLTISGQLTLWKQFGTGNTLSVLNGYADVGILAATASADEFINILNGRLDVGYFSNARVTVNMLDGGTGQFNLADMSGTAEAKSQLDQMVLNFEPGSAASFTIASDGGVTAQGAWEAKIAAGQVQIDGVTETDLGQFKITDVGALGTTISLKTTYTGSGSVLEIVYDAPPNRGVIISGNTDDWSGGLPTNGNTGLIVGGTYDFVNPENGGMYGIWIRQTGGQLTDAYLPMRGGAAGTTDGNIITIDDASNDGSYTNLAIAGELSMWNSNSGDGNELNVLNGYTTVGSLNTTANPAAIARFNILNGRLDVGSLLADKASCTVTMLAGGTGEVNLADMTSTTTMDQIVLNFETGSEASFTIASNGGANAQGTWETKIAAGTVQIDGVAKTSTNLFVITDLGALGATISLAPPPPPDLDPPTPNPAGFSNAPTAISSTELWMTATVGSDASGVVEYLFTETSGNPGGASSGWQYSPNFTAVGLSSNTQYSYTVTMRDAFGNTGTVSSAVAAMTLATDPSGPELRPNDVFVATSGEFAGKLVRYDAAGNPVLLKAFGVNYHDAFDRYINDATDTSFIAGFEYLRDHNIPVARVRAAGFWPNNWNLYFTDKTEYFRRMDYFIAQAEQYDIGLILDCFWANYTLGELVNDAVVAGYLTPGVDFVPPSPLNLDEFGAETYDEYTRAMGRTNSGSNAFIALYTREMVERYKNSPAIWGWEFGNEYNLTVDHPNEPNNRIRKGGAATQGMTLANSNTNLVELPAWTGPDDLVRADVLVAKENFAQTVRSIDTFRLITSGDSNPRASAYHNWTEHTWTTDSRAELAQVLPVDNPAPMDTVTVHIYPGTPTSNPEIYFTDDPVTNQWETGQYKELMDYFVAESAALGQPLIVGEWGATGDGTTADEKTTFDRMMQALIDSGVQLSLLWNFNENILEQTDGYAIHPGTPKEYQLTNADPDLWDLEQANGQYYNLNAPVFTVDPINEANATEDIAFTGSVANATDVDGDTLTYSKLTGPAWLSVATDGSLSGTPAQSDAGANVFTVQVDDGNGATDTATLNLTVDAVNDAPVFAVDPINEANATEDIAYTGSVANATDAEGDTLTYSKLTGPAWLSVATDGSLSGTPLDGDVGSNSFTVQVDDGNGGTDTATLNITVDEFMEAVLAASGVQTLGTMSGTLADTYASDDVYQVLTESGDPSALEHEWTFNVRVGELVTFYVEAYHTANREGDDFVFAYSTNGTDYIEMGIVIDTVDDDTMVWYALPSGTSGTVTVRVLDTDRTGGNTAADSLYVDEIYIVSEDSTVAPAAANTPVPASGTVDVAIDQNLAWTAGAMTVSHDVYFGTTPGAPELQGNQSGIIFDPGVLAYSTTYYWAIDEVNHTGTTAGPVWSFTTAPPAIVPITSITTTSSGTPEQIILNSFTAGGILYTTATDLVTGTSEKTDGSALKGRVIGDQDNFDLNLYFTRGGNPSDNSWDTISFGGENWSNSNGDDADFFIFESVGNDSVSIRPIFTDGSVGQFVVFSVKGGDSTNWGDTNVPITEGARSGQNIFGMAFAITDLVDAAGVALTNSTVIMGLDFDAPGADIASISAVAVP